MDLLSTKGNKFISLLETLNFKSYQNKPTHFNKNSSTCWDVVFCNSPELFNSVETFGCSYSDHNFVAIALNLKPFKLNPITIETRTLSDKIIIQINELFSLAPFGSLKVMPINLRKQLRTLNHQRNFRIFTSRCSKLKNQQIP